MLSRITPIPMRTILDTLPRGVRLQRLYPAIAKTLPYTARNRVSAVDRLPMPPVLLDEGEVSETKACHAKPKNSASPIRISRIAMAATPVDLNATRCPERDILLSEKRKSKATSPGNCLVSSPNGETNYCCGYDNANGYENLSLGRTLAHRSRGTWD